jgi:hypothetical protein
LLQQGIVRRDELKRGTAKVFRPTVCPLVLVETGFKHQHRRCATVTSHNATLVENSKFRCDPLHSEKHQFDSTDGLCIHLRRIVCLFSYSSSLYLRRRRCSIRTGLRVEPDSDIMGLHTLVAVVLFFLFSQTICVSGSNVTSRDLGLANTPACAVWNDPHSSNYESLLADRLSRLFARLLCLQL